jgi:hypothetical protein
MLLDMLTELARREKAANIKPDADIDAFMKVRKICKSKVVNQEDSADSSVRFS